jgi:hypothetical protein
MISGGICKKKSHHITSFSSRITLLTPHMKAENTPNTHTYTHKRFVTVSESYKTMQFQSINTLHEGRICSGSQMSEQSFVSVFAVFCYLL